MPWQEQSVMSLRREFVAAVQSETLPVRVLCRRYGISPKTGYKWLGRAAGEAVVGRADAAWADPLADRSRRPHTSPNRTAADLEAVVVAARTQHPRWGGRKLHHWLLQQGHADVPAPSTITDILRRHGLLAAPPAPAPPWQHFEHAAPNDLWQLDVLGHRPLGTGGRVHPLTLLDDHSRFALMVVACPHEQLARVQAELTGCFQRYGLPGAILTDNGPPWATSGMGGLTRLETWLLRLGVEVWHGRAYHPQTQGKVERLHGTMAHEAFGSIPFATLVAAQAGFDAFRVCYNHERPHEHLGYAVPASRYAPSPRPFPAVLPAPVYAPGDVVRKVREQGAISSANRSYFVSRGLAGESVAVRPTDEDGVVAVYFCQQQVARLTLHRRSET
jgi:transposase InsO family protein